MRVRGWRGGKGLLAYAMIPPRLPNPTCQPAATPIKQRRNVSGEEEGVDGQRRCVVWREHESLTLPMVSRDVHLKPTHRHRQGRVRPHGDQEQRRILETTVVVDLQQDGEPGDADGDGDNGKGEAVLGLVRRKGDDHCEAKGAGPRRDGVELGFDVGVAVALDDAGRKVGVRVCGDDEADCRESEGLLEGSGLGLLFLARCVGVCDCYTHNT